MATKFLDYTGLNYLWGKIKAWCNATFAAITHSHTSNAVNAMTGYSKPSSGSAIATSDSLNSAIGKLEARVDSVDDSNYVHLTGAETVAGIKVFKDGLVLQNDNIPSSGTPSANTAINLMARDIDTTYTHGIFFYRDTTPDSVMYFRVYKPNDSSVYANMQLGYNNDGTTYLIAPSTLTSRINGTDVLTRDWIPKDTRIVHTTGNETIDGTKTFSSTISGSVSGSAGSLANSKPSYGMWLYYRAGQLPIGTSDDSTYSGSSSNYKLWSFPANGTVSTNTVANIQNLRLVWDSSYFTDIFVSPNNHWIWHRDVQTLTPTPWRRIVEENATGVEATTWDISIAGNAATATALVDDSNYVHLSGNQTVTGIKTFSNTVKINNSLEIYNNDIYLMDGRAAGRYHVVRFTHLANRTSYDTSGVCAANFGLQVNDGNIPLCLYSEIRSNGDVRHMFRHAHLSTNDITQFVFLSYKGSQTGYVTTNIDNGYTLGISSSRWSVVYAATASIQTSDIRMKDDISELPQNLLDAWEDIQWLQFKFKDSIEEKGNNARLHTGSIAQSVDNILKTNGINASDYGFFCYDEWEAKEATYDENGQVLDNAQEAGNRYSLRYEEMFAIEAAYQRRKNKILENRISELETQVQNMLQILESLKRA